MTSIFNSDPSSNRPSNGSEHQTIQGIMLAHLFHQTNSLGQLHGKIDGLDRRVNSNTREIAKLKEKQPRTGMAQVLAAIINLAPAIPGLVVLVLALLGKLPWSSVTGSSGH